MVLGTGGAHAVWRRMTTKFEWKPEVHGTKSVRVYAAIVTRREFGANPVTFGDITNNAAAIVFRMMGRALVDMPAEKVVSGDDGGGDAAGAGGAPARGRSGGLAPQGSRFMVDGCPRWQVLCEELTGNRGEWVGYRFWYLIFDPVDLCDRFDQIFMENRARLEDMARNLEQRGHGVGVPTAAMNSVMAMKTRAQALGTGGMDGSPDLMIMDDQQMASVLCEHLGVHGDHSKLYVPDTTRPPLRDHGHFSLSSVFGVENAFRRGMDTVTERQKTNANYFTDAGLNMDRWQGQFPVGVHVFSFGPEEADPDMMARLPLPHMLRESLSGPMMELGRLDEEKHSVSEFLELARSRSDGAEIARREDDLADIGESIDDAYAVMNAEYKALQESSNAIKKLGGCSDGVGQVDALLEQRSIIRQLASQNEPLFKSVRDEFELEAGVLHAAREEHAVCVSEGLDDAATEQRLAQVCEKLRCANLNFVIGSEDSIMANANTVPDLEKPALVGGIDFPTAMTSMYTKATARLWSLWRKSPLVTNLDVGFRNWWEGALQRGGNSAAYGRHAPMYLNLDTVGDAFARLINSFKIISDIETNYAQMTAVFFCAIGGLSVKAGLGFNLCIAGPAGTSKSYTMEQLVHVMPKEAVIDVGRQTENAWTTDHSIAGVMMMHETPPSVFGYDGHGNRVDEDAQLKNRIDNPTVVTFQPDMSDAAKKAGVRELKMFVLEFNVANIFATNTDLPPEETAMMRRIIVWSAVHRADANLAKARSGARAQDGEFSTSNHGSRMDKARESMEHGLKMQSFYIRIWNLLIRAKVMPEIDMSAAKLTFARIFDELEKRYNLTASRSHKIQLLDLTRSITMWYGVSQALFSIEGMSRRFEMFESRADIRSAVRLAEARTTVERAESAVGAGGAAAAAAAGAAASAARHERIGIPNCDRVAFDPSMFLDLLPFGCALESSAILGFSILAGHFVPLIRQDAVAAFATAAKCDEVDGIYHFRDGYAEFFRDYASEERSRDDALVGLAGNSAGFAQSFAPMPPPSTEPAPGSPTSASASRGVLGPGFGPPANIGGAAASAAAAAAAAATTAAAAAAAKFAPASQEFDHRYISLIGPSDIAIIEGHIIPRMSNKPSANDVLRQLKMLGDKYVDAYPRMKVTMATGAEEWIADESKEKEPIKAIIFDAMITRGGRGPPRRRISILVDMIEADLSKAVQTVIEEGLSYEHQRERDVMTCLPYVHRHVFASPAAAEKSGFSLRHPFDRKTVPGPTVRYETIYEVCQTFRVRKEVGKAVISTSAFNRSEGAIDAALSHLPGALTAEDRADIVRQEAGSSRLDGHIDDLTVINYCQRNGIPFRDDDGDITLMTAYQGHARAFMTYLTETYGEQCGINKAAIKANYTESNITAILRSRGPPGGLDGAASAGSTQRYTETLDTPAYTLHGMQRRFVDETRPAPELTADEERLLAVPFEKTKLLSDAERAATTAAARKRLRLEVSPHVLPTDRTAMAAKLKACNAAAMAQMRARKRRRRDGRG